MYNNQFNNNVPNNLDQNSSNFQHNLPYQSKNQPYFNSNINQYNTIDRNNILYYQNNYISGKSLINYNQFSHISQPSNNFHYYNNNSSIYYDHNFQPNISYVNYQNEFKNNCQNDFVYNNQINSNYNQIDPNYSYQIDPNYNNQVDPNYNNQIDPNNNNQVDPNNNNQVDPNNNNQVDPNNNNQVDPNNNNQNDLNSENEELDNSESANSIFYGFYKSLEHYNLADLENESYSIDDLLDYYTKDNDDFKDESIVNLLKNGEVKDGNSIPENQDQSIFEEKDSDENMLHTNQKLDDIVLSDETKQSSPKKSTELNESTTKDNFTSIDSGESISKDEIMSIISNESILKDNLNLSINSDESISKFKLNSSINTTSNVSSKEESTANNISFKDSSVNLSNSNSPEKSNESEIKKRQSPLIEFPLEPDDENILKVKKRKSSLIEFPSDTENDNEQNIKKCISSVFQFPISPENEDESITENAVYDLLKLKIGRLDLDLNDKATVNKQKQNLFLPRSIGRLSVIYDRERLVYEFYASDVETDDAGDKTKIYKLFKMMIPFNLIDAINMDENHCELKILLNSRPFLFVYDQEERTYDFKTSTSSNTIPVLTDYCYHGVHLLHLENLKQLDSLKRGLLNYSTYKFKKHKRKYKEVKIKLFKKKLNKKIGQPSMYVGELNELNWIDVLNKNFVKNDKRVNRDNFSNDNVDVLTALTAIDLKIHNVGTPSTQSPTSGILPYLKKLDSESTANKKLKFPKKKKKSKSKRSSDHNDAKSLNKENLKIFDTSDSSSENVPREVSNRCRIRDEMREKKRRIREQQNQLNQLLMEENRQKESKKKSRKLFKDSRKKNALKYSNKAKSSTKKIINQPEQQKDQIINQPEQQKEQHPEDQNTIQHKQDQHHESQNVNQQQVSKVDQLQQISSQQSDKLSVLNEDLATEAEPIVITEIDYDCLILDNENMDEPIDLSEKTKEQVDHKIIELNNEQIDLSSDEEPRLVIDEDYEEDQTEPVDRQLTASSEPVCKKFKTIDEFFS